MDDKKSDNRKFFVLKNMMKDILFFNRLILPILYFLFSFKMSSAAGPGQLGSFKELIDYILKYIFTPLISLFIGVAVLYFFWGIINFIRAEGEEKEKGRMYMIWGIVGLFVMISVWGLVNVLQSTFNFDNTDINVPSVII